MEVTPELRARVLRWLEEYRRECPCCHASPQFLEITSIDDDVLRPSEPGHGIDTSDTYARANLRCTRCNYDRMILELDDNGLR